MRLFAGFVVAVATLIAPWIAFAQLGPEAPPPLGATPPSATAAPTATAAPSLTATAAPAPTASAAPAPTTSAAPPDELYDDEPEPEPAASASIAPPPPPPRSKPPARRRIPTVELGGDVGVVWRSLSDINYKPGLNMQLRADVAIIPPFITIGAYFSVAQLVPTSSSNTTTTSGGITTTVTSDDPTKDIQFLSGGLRVRVRIPVGTDFMPYGLLGGGFVYGNFPSEHVTVCGTVSGVSGCSTPQEVPNATTIFGEIVIGAGAILRLADVVFLNAEIAYRPTFGYKNDTYNNAVAKEDATIPPPSSNGNAVSAVAGLTIGF